MRNGYKTKRRIKVKINRQDTVPITMFVQFTF